MRLTRLELHQFRSYERLELDVDAAGLRVHGANASGKTTLLEAIMMLASTKSPRTGTERELIRWGSGEDYGVAPYARIVGRVERADGPVEVEIALAIQEDRPNAVRKSIKINGRPARASDAVGRINAVFFSPEDVALLTGSPAERRRFVDIALAQTSGAYLQALSRYQRVTEQRNGLLKTLQRDGVSPHAPHVSAQLGFWDEQFLALASLIMAHRVIALGAWGDHAAEKFRVLTGAAEFRLAYQPSLAGDWQVPPAGSIEVVQSRIHRALQETITDRRVEEVRRGVTVVGPHRDDIGCFVGETDLGVYGSRGQQRMAVVALKLAECALMAERAGEPPLLLLDDVLSELDARHRGLMEQELEAVGAQLFVTGTDPDEWTGSLIERLPVAEAITGTLRPSGG